jgi:hypothetical protein
MAKVVRTLPCEPPPELRDVEGWHWLVREVEGEVTFRALLWTGRGWDDGLVEWVFPAIDLAGLGWRYHAPAIPPPEPYNSRLPMPDPRQGAPTLHPAASSGERQPLVG